MAKAVSVSKVRSPVATPYSDSLCIMLKPEIRRNILFSPAAYGKLSDVFLQLIPIVPVACH